jgi:hypothetical protein
VRLYRIAVQLKEHPRLVGSSACTFFVMAEGGREAEQRSLEIARFFRFSSKVDISSMAQGMLEHVLIGGSQNGAGGGANRHTPVAIRSERYGSLRIGRHLIRFPGWHHS